MVSKKAKKKKTIYLFFTFLNLGKTYTVLGKKVAIFDWENGPSSAARDGQKISCNKSFILKMWSAFYVRCCAAYIEMHFQNTFDHGRKHYPKRAVLSASGLIIVCKIGVQIG